MFLICVDACTPNMTVFDQINKKKLKVVFK